MAFVADGALVGPPRRSSNGLARQQVRAKVAKVPGKRRRRCHPAHVKVGTLLGVTPRRALDCRVAHQLAGAGESVTPLSMLPAPATTGANPDVDPRRSPSLDHGGAFYLDCETTGVDVSAKITCVAITTDAGHTTTWHSGHAELMSEDVASTVVDHIMELLEAGAILYTFNGAAFDLKLLWMLSKRDELKQIALQHRDLLVDFVANTRYYSSMNSFAVPTLGAAEAKTNNGAWAVTAWFDGQAAEVLQYCIDDTVVLKRLVQHIRKYGALKRLTKAGKESVWVLPTLNGTVRSVDNALANSCDVPGWMNDPPALPDVAWTASSV